MDEVEAHTLAAEWESAHWHRGVLLNGDYAPMEEAEALDLPSITRFVLKALAAMADAGVVVSRGPLRVVDDKLVVELDGVELMARDPIHDHPSLAVEVILGRLDTIAAQRESVARWHFWYTGDPVGAGFFVTPEELITTVGIDVRELGAAQTWYRPHPG